MSVRARNLVGFGYLSFMAMWVICEIVEIAMLGLNKNLSLWHDGKLAYLSDFVHFYLAGKMTLSPARSFFYSWEAQKPFLKDITLGPLPVEDFYTPYLPIVFLMMVPYSLMPINFAHLVFDVVNTGIGLAGCFMLIKHFHWTENKTAWWVLLGTLASFPCANCWLLGQISWLYVGLICFYLVSMLQKRDALAGLALFLTIIKPQYAAFLLIPAFYLSRFRLLLYAAGWGILFLVMFIFVFSGPAIIAYPGVLNGNELSLHSVNTSAMYCVRSFLELFLSQRLAYYGSVFLWAAALLFLVVSIVPHLLKKESQSVLSWLTSVVIVASVLFSPHAYAHDVMLLIVPALLTLPNGDFDRQSVELTIWRSIIYILPLISWLCYVLVCLHLPGNFIFTGIMAVLFICGLRQLGRLSKPTLLKT